MGCGGSKSSSSDEQPSLIRQNVRKTGPATFKVVMLGNKAVGKSRCAQGWCASRRSAGLRPPLAVARPQFGAAPHAG